MQRRSFVKVCASAATAVSANPALVLSAPGKYQAFSKTQLVDGNGNPLLATALDTGINYVFAYPYTQTPCFLLDLGRRANANDALTTQEGDSYTWPGGVGKNNNIVAFSAICTHKLSHPAKTISFISYRHDKVTFYDHVEKKAVKSQQLILCCSEGSVYDPARGAQVLGGPAPMPLAAIDLEVGSDGTLFARGVFGADVFERFFAKFGPRFALEQGSSNIKQAIDESSQVHTLEEYSRVLRQC